MSMKIVKVAEATNTQLDWLVAKCEGYERDTVTSHVLGKGFVTHDAPFGFYVGLAEMFEPTTNPDQMWPIIEREDIALGHGNSKADPDNRYEASIIGLHPWAVLAQGSTKLIAAARCYVISKLGETVEVPEELT